MSRIAITGIAAASLLLLSAAIAEASSEANASLLVQAEISTRTSLRVSGEVLHFDVREPGVPATAFIEFSASARTRAGGEVVLSVEPLGQIAWDTSGSQQPVLTLAGNSNDSAGGDFSSSPARVARRWAGSGTRGGTLTFALRASSAGAYVVPMRVVLSAP